MKPTLGILLEFGFHEIKKYIHSGFSKKAAEKFNIIWFYIDKGSQEFDDYFQGTGFPMVKIDESKLRNGISQIEARNDSVRRAWMVSNRLGAFHNYKLINKLTLRDKIIGTNLIKKYYERKALKEIANIYNSPYLAQLLYGYKVQHLLATGYSSLLSRTAFVTANASNIKTWYLVNSWKDLYVNNFIPVDSLDGIFVWSDDMYKSYLKHMPYLKKSHIVITGNPTFDALIEHQNTKLKSHYASKYGVSESAKWVVYTLMPPGMNNDEIETTILVANELKKKYSSDEVVILLRRNPNHDKDDFKEINLPNNLVLTEHFCTFDKEKDLIIQSKEGEDEWLDILHYADINFSVPSTVTLEFITLNKPIINIGFGSDGKFNTLLLQHFEAGFYKKLFSDNPLVNQVLSVEHLLIKVEETLGLLDARQKHLDKTSLSSDKIIQHIT